MFLLLSPLSHFPRLYRECFVLNIPASRRAITRAFLPSLTAMHPPLACLLHDRSDLTVTSSSSSESSSSYLASTPLLNISGLPTHIASSCQDSSKRYVSPVARDHAAPESWFSNLWISPTSLVRLLSLFYLEVLLVSPFLHSLRTARHHYPLNAAPASVLLVALQHNHRHW